MKRILKARTERDLDLAYRDAMTALVTDAGLTDLLATRLATDLFENQNDIRTIGSMQVSVDFAIATEEAARGKPLSLDDIHRLRDRLYTRKGGMHYGVLQLLGYQTGYDRKVYRFADYNAGRYASRNAALQHAVSRLSGRPLALDGDMLAYGSDGMALGRRSSTELAILSIARSLGLTDRQIRKDLRQEKHQDFTSTQTFKRIRSAYKARFGSEPPFAMLPDIQLKSVKIARRMTTADFAQAVSGRYRKCMARAGSPNG